MSEVKEGIFYKRPSVSVSVTQEKVGTRKKLGIVAKILLAVVGVAGLVSFLSGAVLIVLIALIESGPADQLSGIEAYDKEALLDTYGSDFDSGLFLFPDNTEDMIAPTYESSLKSGLFDTDGYVILQTSYDDTKYQEEVERISRVECKVSFKTDSVTQKVKYDEENYSLPAYVAADGFTSVYEYALLNDAEKEITYILLCYPRYEELSQYEKYLKRNPSEYEIEDTLNQFSIYAHTFNDGDSWTVYSDDF